MTEIFRGYVATKNKKCIQKFGHGEPLLSLEEAMKLREFAGILNGEFTVVDVDVTEVARALYRLVKEKDLNCRVYKTTRGYHFVFMNSEYIRKNTVKAINALGVEFDCRYGKNAYILLKHDGLMRQIVRDFDGSRPVDALPKFLMAVKGVKTLFGMGEGSGRNSALFGHIIPLVRSGFHMSEARDILRLINEYVFAESLPEEEMAKILRDEAFVKIADSSCSAADDFGSAIRPADFSDAGTAAVFASEYADKARFSTAHGWLVWNGSVWETSDLKAQQLQIELTLHLLKDAVSEVKAAHAALADAQVSDDAEAVSKAKAAVVAAGGYHKFALRMREHSKVSGVLKLARSALEIKPDALDANPFEINTPSGLVCLRTGVQSGHRPEALCTKMTRFTPSDEGMNEWLGLVETITVFDEEYQRFLQHLAGAIAVGKVYTEAMVIAHGSGANGKSTFFNTLAAVLGDYAGKIPAEALTTRAKNVKVDLAELLGKRLIIASETEEGQRISTGMVKQVASVDTITAERKYHDPFTFQPSHTLILYTNHLPKVGSADHGTWRRLVVAPFGAVIHNPQTDYAEKLLAKSGGAVMKWIIEGAMMFIAGGFKLPRCAAVENAVARYRQENDWLSAFLTERCNVALGERCFGGELYAEYRRWAGEQGEYIRSTSDFTAALVSAGFERKKTKAGAVWFGLSVCEVQPFLAASDAVRKPTACAR